MSFLGEWSEILRELFTASGKVTSWLLKLSIDYSYPEKSGDMFCIIPIVKSCHSYTGSANTLIYM